MSFTISTSVIKLPSISLLFKSKPPGFLVLKTDCLCSLIKSSAMALTFILFKPTPLDPLEEAYIPSLAPYEPEDLVNSPASIKACFCIILTSIDLSSKFDSLDIYSTSSKPGNSLGFCLTLSTKVLYVVI